MHKRREPRSARRDEKKRLGNGGCVLEREPPLESDECLSTKDSNFTSGHEASCDAFVVKGTSTGAGCVALVSFPSERQTTVKASKAILPCFLPPPSLSMPQHPKAQALYLGNVELGAFTRFRVARGTFFEQQENAEKVAPKCIGEEVVGGLLQLMQGVVVARVAKAIFPGRIHPFQQQTPDEFLAHRFLALRIFVGQDDVQERAFVWVHVVCVDLGVFVQQVHHFFHVLGWRRESVQVKSGQDAVCRHRCHDTVENEAIRPHVLGSFRPWSNPMGSQGQTPGQPSFLSDQASPFNGWVDPDRTPVGFHPGSPHWTVRSRRWTPRGAHGRSRSVWTRAAPALRFGGREGSPGLTSA